jgi:para-nitrobenzyl esterase
VPQESVTAATAAGAVIGRVIGDALAFSGIPYGRAERFRKPEPASPWSEPFDATAPGPRAIQGGEADPEFGGIPTDLLRYFTGGTSAVAEPMNEDCQVLHIVTPAVDQAARPVLVYIHGGGFDSGSAAPVLRSSRLAVEEDVVVVGINHRLNVFGFLRLEEFPDASNAGLLDIVEGLRWVSTNIAAFGGDPANVTLFGESGGGMKIGALLAMPTAKGLFHKAIIQSGSRLKAGDAEVSDAVSAALTSRLEKSAHELATMPAGELFDAWQSLGLSLAATVDDRWLPNPPFDPGAPETAADVPLIVGNTLDEFSLFLAFADDATLAAMVPFDGEVRTRIEGAYEKDFPDVSHRQRLVRILSDITFGNAAVLQGERKAAQGAAVFRYVVAYSPSVADGAFGAFHGMDVPLLLRSLSKPELEPVALAMGSAWAAFARTADPSTEERVWPRFDADARSTMIFDDESGVEENPYPNVRGVWAELPTTMSIRESLGNGVL